MLVIAQNCLERKRQRILGLFMKRDRRLKNNPKLSCAQRKKILALFMKWG